MRTASRLSMYGRLLKLIILTAYATYGFPTYMMDNTNCDRSLVVGNKYMNTPSVLDTSEMETVVLDSKGNILQNGGIVIKNEIVSISVTVPSSMIDFVYLIDVSDGQLHGSKADMDDTTIGCNGKRAISFELVHLECNVNVDGDGDHSSSVIVITTGGASQYGAILIRSFLLHVMNPYSEEDTSSTTPSGSPSPKPSTISLISPSGSPSTEPTTHPASLPQEALVPSISNADESAPIYTTDPPRTQDPSIQPTSMPTPEGQVGLDWYYNVNFYMSLVWLNEPTFSDTFLGTSIKKGLSNVLGKLVLPTDITSISAKPYSRFLGGPEKRRRRSFLENKYTIIYQVNIVSMNYSASTIIYEIARSNSLDTVGLYQAISSYGVTDLKRIEMQGISLSTLNNPSNDNSLQYTYIMIGLAIFTTILIVVVLFYFLRRYFRGGNSSESKTLARQILGQRFPLPFLKKRSSDREYLKLYEDEKYEESETTVNFDNRPEENSDLKP